MPDSVLGTIMVQAGGSAAIGGGSLPSSLTGADREADKAVKPTFFQLFIFSPLLCLILIINRVFLLRN